MAKLDLDALEQAAREAGGGCWFSTGWTVGSRGFEVGDLKSRDRLKAAEKRTAKLEERCAVLTDSLRLAVRQNNHDMLMTAEELRSCEAILEETK